ncbi:MAG: glycosyl transferase, partial [Acidobacteria bacterium]|nr:glycosyl transferase [Acidobacteriota bacterium]
PLYFLVHPIASILFAYILLRSMLLTFHHGGVMWRGTLYPLDQLKSGMAIE